MIRDGSGGGGGGESFHGESDMVAVTDGAGSEVLFDETVVGRLPEQSGVYLFRDDKDAIIYVGKARNLKERVKSYTQKGKKEVKTEHLVQRIHRVQVIVTNNEKEAFLLENNLIKEHRPKYNVSLKDDKTFVSLKLTVGDPFPALFITRKIEDDKSLYFGPYPQVRDMRAIIKIVQNFYPVRRCRNSVFRKRQRPCILYQMGKCLGPCAESVDHAAYREMINELTDFLSGRNEKLLKDLKDRIEEASSQWRFEEAKVLKDRYDAIGTMMEKQNVHQHMGKNRDLWAFERTGKNIRAVVLTFQRGVLIFKRVFRDVLSEAPVHDSIATLLFQFYQSAPVPEEIVLSEELEGMETIARVLGARRGFVPKLHGPSSRLGRELLPLALENLRDTEAVPLDQALERALRLKVVPKRIEIFDISHTQGENPTGGMVVFAGLKPYKQGYRIFHIRDAYSLDDTAMMAEVLRRRLTDDAIGPLPDLIVLDGGKGHLSAVGRVLRDLKIERDYIGIAKGVRRKALDDLIYLPGRKNPVVFSRTSPVLKFIARMRDEAHRFALSSQRKRKLRNDLSRT